MATAQVRADYAKTLILLRALKAGTVALENLTLTGDGWSVGPVPIKTTWPAMTAAPGEEPVAADG